MVNICFEIDQMLKWIRLDIQPRQGEIAWYHTPIHKQHFSFHWYIEAQKATDLVDCGICEIGISPDAYHAHTVQGHSRPHETRVLMQQIKFRMKELTISWHILIYFTQIFISQTPFQLVALYAQERIFQTFILVTLTNYAHMFSVIIVELAELLTIQACYLDGNMLRQTI